MSFLLFIIPIVAAQGFNTSSTFQPTPITSIASANTTAGSVSVTAHDGEYGFFSDGDLEIYTTCYTKPFPTICGSELCDYTYTITEYCTTPCGKPGPTDIPSGFTTTVTECGGFDVTITEPIPGYYPTDTEAFPTGIIIDPIETGFPDPDDVPISIDNPSDCFDPGCDQKEPEGECFDLECIAINEPEPEPEIEIEPACGEPGCIIPEPEEPEPGCGGPECDFIDIDIDGDIEPEVCPGCPGATDGPQIQPIKPIPTNTDGPCTLICIPDVPTPSGFPMKPPNCFTKCPGTGAPPTPTSPPGLNNLTVSAGTAEPTAIPEGEGEPEGTGAGAGAGGTETFTGGAAGRTEWTAAMALGVGIIVAATFM
ncbi:hypothetical protein EDC01DRAFT_633867 [Geopyxis carbonaria]|nr:hypothetical protein EDC01DRAFT_633867 [Geopyxis carbonaria]